MREIKMLKKPPSVLKELIYKNIAVKKQKMRNL
jgi:hypothetical protein